MIEKTYNLKNGKSVLIREAMIADAIELNEVENIIKIETDTASCHPEIRRTIEETTKFISDFLEDGKLCYLIVIYENKIVAKGHIDNWLEGGLQYSELVIDVLKDYWGLGIGGKLMQELICFASKDLEKLYLTVASKNVGAINLYKSFGFVEESRDVNGWKLPDGTYCDSIDMVKDLRNIE